MKRLLLVLYLANLAVILYFWWQGSGALLSSNASGLLIGLARLSGLLGMFSVLTQYTLMSRNPLILRYLGLESHKLHRYNGLATLSLITLHVVLVTVGYSLASGQSWLAQDIDFITKFPYVWLAAIAYLVMLTTVGLSLEFVRRRLRPKVWYSIHVFNHSIVWLAIWHQLKNGGTLLSSSSFRLYWLFLVIFAVSHLIYFRFLYPRINT